MSRRLIGLFFICVAAFTWAWMLGVFVPPDAESPFAAWYTPGFLVTPMILSIAALITGLLMLFGSFSSASTSDLGYPNVSKKLPITGRYIAAYCIYAAIFIGSLLFMVIDGHSEWSLYIGRLWVLGVVLLGMTAYNWFSGLLAYVIGIGSALIFVTAIGYVTYGHRVDEFSSQSAINIPMLFAFSFVILWNYGLRALVALAFNIPPNSEQETGDK